MKVLVIPDCHLKPWMFAQADAIVKKGIADKAVCLMDLADDFGVHDDAQYLETYETAIAFAKEHPDTLWCYGNHDLSYIWGKPETGYHPEKRGLVCQEIKKLTNTLPKKSQLAYIHKIDKTLFMHGGLANLFVQLRVAPQNRKNVLAVIKVINQMGCETMWAADSPIWYRPQLSPNQNAKRLYRGGKYLQVVGHTPVKEVHLEDGVLPCDTFSTYRDGTPYGSQAFCIVDYTKEADAWMAEKQNLIARKTGTPIPAAQPTQATPAVPPPFVPTAPAKSHEYYCCLARWDGSYIGYETYKSEQAAQNARKQIARRGETAVYATVEEAEAWVEQQKAARTRR